LCGWAWRDGPTHWATRPLAVGIVSGIVVGESAYMLGTMGSGAGSNGLIPAILMLVGMGLPGILLRSSRDLIAGYATIVLCLLPGLILVPLLRSLMKVTG
jgi:hypothetical protein